MELQIELPDMHRGVLPVLGARRLEERIGVAHAHPGSPLQVSQAPGPFHHLGGRAATAVAVTERDHLVCGDPLLRVVVDGSQVFFGG